MPERFEVESVPASEIREGEKVLQSERVWTVEVSGPSCGEIGMRLRADDTGEKYRAWKRPSMPVLRVVPVPSVGFCGATDQAYRCTRLKEAIEVLVELVRLYDLKQENPEAYEMQAERKRAAWFKAKAIVSACGSSTPEQSIEPVEAEAILAAFSGARYWTVGVEGNRPWVSGAPFESDEGMSPRVRVIEAYPLLHALTIARAKRRTAHGSSTPEQPDELEALTDDQMSQIAEVADDAEHEQPRPEIAFAARRGARPRRVLAPYHLTNVERPWETACGLLLDGTSVKPLGSGDWLCQHHACQRALSAAASPPQTTEKP